MGMWEVKQSQQYSTPCASSIAYTETCSRLSLALKSSNASHSAIESGRAGSLFDEMSSTRRWSSCLVLVGMEVRTLWLTVSFSRCCSKPMAEGRLARRLLSSTSTCMPGNYEAPFWHRSKLYASSRSVKHKDQRHGLKRNDLHG